MSGGGIRSVSYRGRVGSGGGRGTLAVRAGPGAAGELTADKGGLGGREEGEEGAIFSAV